MSISHTLSAFVKEMVDIQANIIITGEKEESIQHAFHYLFSLYNPAFRIVSIDIPHRPVHLPNYLSLISNDDYDAAYYMSHAVRMNPHAILLSSLDEQTTYPFLQVCTVGFEGSCSGHISSHPEHTLSNLQQIVEKIIPTPKESIQSFIKEGVDIFLHCKEVENETIIEQVYCFDNHSYTLQPLWNKESDCIIEEHVSVSIQRKRERFIERNTPVVKVGKPKRTILSKDYQKHAIKFLSEYGKKHDMKELEKRLFPVLEPAISIQRIQKEDKEIPIGSSKFGGDPDLPLSIPYPYYEDIPYRFILQINCEEVASHDVSSKLPKTGILYFFHLFEDDCIPMYFSKKDDFQKYEKSVLVFHYEGDIAELMRTKVPETEHFEPVLSATVSFVTRYTIPKPSERASVYEFLGYSQEEIWDDDDLLENIHHALPRLAFETPDDLLSDEESLYHIYDEPFHQLYGEPEFCQAYPLDELQPWTFPKANVEKNDYTLLIQFEVDEEIDLWWAADGGMYYYISAEGLANKNFSTVYSIMQCG